MWRRRRMEQYLSPIQEIQEVETPQGQQSPTSSQQSEHDFGGDYSYDENETDDEAFHGSGDAPDLLFSSIELRTQYQFNYVLSVRSSERASTSCIRPPSYPHIVYYPGTRERSSSSSRTIDDVQPMEQSDDNQSDDNVFLNSTLNRPDLVTPELNVSPPLSSILPMRTFKRKTLFSKKRLFQKDCPVREPAQIRRRLRSVPRLAPPSNLATQVANRVISYARCIRNIHEKDMCCLDCGLLPITPVTGQCGHTRCIKCIEEHRSCPCGTISLDETFVNILIRDLIGKTVPDGISSRIVPIAANNVAMDDVSAGSSSTEYDTEITYHSFSGAGTLCTSPIQQKHKARACTSSSYPDCNPRIPMSPRARYNHAVELLESGRYHEAAPHLALAAASAQPDLRPARILLAQVITLISKNRDPRVLTRQLNRVVRQLSLVSIKLRDIECILCCDTFTNPVTTPCGHTFCRICIERTLDYRKRCPLCLRSLNEFNLAETRDTVFVQAALKSINAVKPPPPLEPDLIPIFVCTVAYPSVPCPLFIFDPRYWLMIRRVLESGSRKFGMVACDRGQDYSDYGTILEVRDCVHLEDGRSILSTIGLSRFKVTERGVRDGCEVARILRIIDVPAVDHMEIWELKMMANQIIMKALLWLSRLNGKVLAEIEAAFGRLPFSSTDEAWWESTDGPSWLWWLVAVLPLRSEIKILILSTDCLLKRLLAVARTLAHVMSHS